jgi:hypothetical protein
MLPFNPLSLLVPNATLSFLLALSIFFFFNAVILVSLGALLCLLYFFSNKSFFGKSIVHNDVFCGIVSNLANFRVTGLSSYTFFFFNTLSNVTRSVDGLLRLKLSNFIVSLWYNDLRSITTPTGSPSAGFSGAAVMAGLPRFRAMLQSGSAPLLQSYKTAYHLFFITSFFTPGSTGLSTISHVLHTSPRNANSLLSTPAASVALFSDLSATAVFNLRGFTALSAYSSMSNQLANH